eukprot:TRINITY_DN7629_c1_g1::TRINITY_DN7629_c1_g1_i1::g.18491::m.18491 TRINITY_DN7629_c1_g1::TRINITY_DN7629_c1_g1_i1::g.18491  ORF type:complete len:195 (+),score=4.52,Siva/PF05458.7/0.048,Siva/PF05458.7/5.4e+02 TRINITY_DN7629_c1_g1_i1:199-783(+)
MLSEVNFFGSSEQFADYILKANTKLPSKKSIPSPLTSLSITSSVPCPTIITPSLCSSSISCGSVQASLSPVTVYADSPETAICCQENVFDAYYYAQAKATVYPSSFSSQHRSISMSSLSSDGTTVDCSDTSCWEEDTSAVQCHIPSYYDYDALYNYDYLQDTELRVDSFSEKRLCSIEAVGPDGAVVRVHSSCM